MTIIAVHTAKPKPDKRTEASESALAVASI